MVTEDGREALELGSGELGGEAVRGNAGEVVFLRVLLHPRRYPLQLLFAVGVSSGGANSLQPTFRLARSSYFSIFLFAGESFRKDENYTIRISKMNV